MSNKNEIKGGSRSTYAYAICDDWCGDLYEMSDEVASQFGHSPYHRWVEVYDIRTNKDYDQIVKRLHYSFHKGRHTNHHKWHKHKLT